MKPAPVQNSSSVSTLRSSSGSLYRSNTFAYPDQTEHPLASPFVSKLSLFFLVIFSAIFSFGQDTITKDAGIQVSQQPNAAAGEKQYDGPDKNRVWLIAGINAVAYGGTLIALNNAWYKDYPKTSFHTFNDSKEWLQMDKVGHAWGA